jgi:hypothetical protein
MVVRAILAFVLRSCMMSVMVEVVAIGRKAIDWINTRLYGCMMTRLLRIMVYQWLPAVRFPVVGVMTFNGLVMQLTNFCIVWRL